MPISFFLVGGFKHLNYFHNIWDNPSHCLIFFRGVETTNQFCLKVSQISWDPRCLSYLGPVLRTGMRLPQRGQVHDKRDGNWMNGEGWLASWVVGVLGEGYLLAIEVSIFGPHL
jgi:hypothetical protein